MIKPILPKLGSYNPIRALLAALLVSVSSNAAYCYGFASSSQVSIWMKTTPRSRISNIQINASSNRNGNYVALSQPTSDISRNRFLEYLIAIPTSVAVMNGLSAHAFDGGVGGLGKTKPITGVQFYDSDGYLAPVQNSKGIVSAEIQSLDKGKPILVQFQTPWPLLPTTSGLEARDLQSSESAFVQVVPVTKNWQDKKVFTQLLMESVLASQGKYGAYGTPTDIKVRPIGSSAKGGESSTSSIGFSVTFTSYTPAMRESERQVWVVPKQVDSATLVMLVVGTTRARFASQAGTIESVADSFQAAAAPQSRRGQ